MIHVDILGAYLLAIITLIATPGPVVALVIRNSLSAQNLAKRDNNKDVEGMDTAVCGFKECNASDSLVSEANPQPHNDNTWNRNPRAHSKDFLKNAKSSAFKNAFYTICGTNGGSLVLIAFSVCVILGIARISNLALALFSLLGSIFIFYLGFSSLFGALWRKFKARKDSHRPHSHNLESSGNTPPTRGYDKKDFLQTCGTDLTNARSHNALKSKATLDNAPLSARKCFTQGLLLSLSNPKDILFFVAFFPQFMGITDSKSLSIALLVGLWIVLDFTLLLAISFVSSTFLAQKTRLERLNKALTILSDSVLMVVGIGGAVYGIFYFV